MKFGSLKTNSPIWAKRLRIGFAALFAGIIGYSDLLAPMVNLDPATFDKWAALGGFISTWVFSLFGVDDENTQA